MYPKDPASAVDETTNQAAARWLPGFPERREVGTILVNDELPPPTLLLDR